LHPLLTVDPQCQFCICPHLEHRLGLTSRLINAIYSHYDRKLHTTCAATYNCRREFMKAVRRLAHVPSRASSWSRPYAVVVSRSSRATLSNSVSRYHTCFIFAARCLSRTSGFGRGVDVPAQLIVRDPSFRPPTRPWGHRVRLHL
jgi:hypothetical protein